MAAMVDDVEVVSPGAGPPALMGTAAGAEVEVEMELVTAPDGSTTPVMSGAPISTVPPTNVVVVEL